MATFTVSIPQELKEKMDEHPEINWAQYLKKRFELRVKELQKFEELKKILSVPRYIENLGVSLMLLARM